MKVPDEVRKCVCFIGFENKITSSVSLVGTGFFFGLLNEDQNAVKLSYVVTARHVIEGLTKRGIDRILLILNGKATSEKNRYIVSSRPADWYIPNHNADICFAECGIPDFCDHIVFPDNLCINDDIIAENEIGLGDEVFITGLFTHHAGKSKNIPIVRIGNLAAGKEEKIQTKEYGEIDAYLIECRSIGGLSGSPVFLNLGNVRVLGGNLKFMQGSHSRFYLLGLVHGHFDTRINSDDVKSDTLSEARINTGIAIVTPIEELFKVIGESKKA